MNSFGRNPETTFAETATLERSNLDWFNRSKVESAGGLASELSAGAIHVRAIGARANGPRHNSNPS
jgi:hypothetical protein